MILLLLTALAFGDDDVHAVEDGAAVEVTGPAVWMTENRFRQYVADSRKLPVCTEALDKAIDLSIEANERALKSRDLAEAEFHLADEEDAAQVQTIAELSVRVDDLAGKVDRVRAQRNVAWGIAGGFLAASASAVVLSLPRLGV
jgi:hypothetical protein